MMRELHPKLEHFCKEHIGRLKHQRRYDPNNIIHK